MKMCILIHTPRWSTKASQDAIPQNVDRIGLAGQPPALTGQPLLMRKLVTVQGSHAATHRHRWALWLL